jgi:hypothetical protein
MAWRSLDGRADVVLDDDRSDRRTLEASLPGLAARCDILLGPYSTLLMRTAGRIAVDLGSLIWNHGGAGDDVEHTYPAHVVSVLTPASRYAEPFLRFVAGGNGLPRDLCVVHGSGSFGRQVADGATTTAAQLGIRILRAGPDEFPPSGLAREWDLFSAGVFEQDAKLARRALRLPAPPQRICTVAAGVREFAQAVDDTDGMFGIGQWFPGAAHRVLLGPGEENFLNAYTASGGGVPDYPAAQAAAAAAIAVHCARLAASTKREDLWSAAASLDTSTLFGGFRIDPASGTQVKHETGLVRWAGGEPIPVPRPGQVLRRVSRPV